MLICASHVRRPFYHQKSLIRGPMSQIIEGIWLKGPRGFLQKCDQNVTAVAGFFIMVFAFYIFFVPFLEHRILKISSLVAYSVMSMVVSALYIRCVAVDPSDCQVVTLRKPKDKIDAPVVIFKPRAQKLLSGLFTFISFSDTECCRGRGASSDVPLSENETLHCRSCHVKISPRSKHCRVCDKCVDGFDHHCRWLNNCVGRKNYSSFISLLNATIVMFILQWSFGLWILVDRLPSRHNFKALVALNLGRSFPSVVYLLVLVSCTVLSMAVTYFVGQLTVFHVVLIRKGMTTYDYIMAKRNQEIKPEKKEGPSSLAPAVATSAAPTFSDGSYSGRLQQELVQQNLFGFEQEVSHGEICHTRQDKDEGGSWRSFSQRFSKRKASVKINPWMSFLDEGDKSQIVLPCGDDASAEQPPVLAMAERGSSFGSSQRVSADIGVGHGMGSNFLEVGSNRLDESIVSTWQNGKLPFDFLEQMDSSENDSGTLSHHVATDKVPNPLQREARNVFKSSHSFCGRGLSLPISGGPPSCHVQGSPSCHVQGSNLAENV